MEAARRAGERRWSDGVACADASHAFALGFRFGVHAGESAVSQLRQVVAPGELVFREGDPPTTAFVIESGAIEVSTLRGEERVVLAHLGPGDLFGEMAMIDSAPRSASARALGETVLLLVDSNQINERLTHADPIISALLRAQLQRYRSALRRFGDPRSEWAESAHAMAAQPSQHVGAIGKIRMDSELRGAIESQELDVRFQPILDLRAQCIGGYEALLRWQHPARGPVSPAEFIPVAEETSLIIPLGRFVLDRAARLLAGLRRHGVQPLPAIAVNVSGRQLDDGDVLDDLMAAARRHDVPADRLKLELTESLTLDTARTVAFLTRCHHAGIKVSLDDFGTGYSNLGQLHRMEFDTIKLDQSLVRTMLGNTRAQAIVQAAIAMSHALGADLVAEGVELVEERDHLQRLGCGHAQGYLIGRPMAEADVLLSWRDGAVPPILAAPR